MAPGDNAILFSIQNLMGANIILQERLGYSSVFGMDFPPPSRYGGEAISSRQMTPASPQRNLRPPSRRHYWTDRTKPRSARHLVSGRCHADTCRARSVMAEGTPFGRQVGSSQTGPEINIWLTIEADDVGHCSSDAASPPYPLKRRPREGRRDIAGPLFAPPALLHKMKGPAP